MVTAVTAISPARRIKQPRGRRTYDALIETGFKLLEQIRSHRNPRVRQVPAAALTAFARSDDRVKALRAGFSIHLAKPIEPAELVAAVAALARRPSAES